MLHLKYEQQYSCLKVKDKMNHNMNKIWNEVHYKRACQLTIQLLRIETILLIIVKE